MSAPRVDRRTEFAFLVTMYALVGLSWAQERRRRRGTIRRMFEAIGAHHHRYGA